MKPHILPILVMAPLASLIIGAFLFFKPALAIELQKRFYAMLNWLIEPISMPKEIRNTKAMGLALVVIAVIAAAFILMRGGS